MVSAVIVTTEKHNSAELGEMLIRDGRIHTLSTYADPCDALRHIDETQPDVVFIDFNLPGTNGLNLASRIREVNRQVFIVLLADAKDHALDAYSAGVSDYILKPYREQRIKKVLERISVPRAI